MAVLLVNTYSTQCGFPILRFYCMLRTRIHLRYSISIEAQINISSERLWFCLFENICLSTLEEIRCHYFETIYLSTEGGPVDRRSERLSPDLSSAG